MNAIEACGHAVGPTLELKPADPSVLELKGGGGWRRKSTSLVPRTS